MSKENKTKKPFYKRWWFIVIVAILILGGIGGGMNGGKSDDGTKPNNNETTVASTSSETETKVQSSTEIEDPVIKIEIQEAVAKLIEPEYKDKDGFYNEVLTLVDGGYSVSLQIPLELDKPESTQYVKQLVDKIIELKNDDIKEIRINTLKKMQIIDMYWWPNDGLLD